MHKLTSQLFFLVFYVVAVSVGADPAPAPAPAKPAANVKAPPVAKPVGDSKLTPPTPPAPTTPTTPTPATTAAQPQQPTPPPPPPFKFSISYKQMNSDPRKSQVIVEKELGPDPSTKVNEEIEARHNLGFGFEAIGDFDSAAKNFARCRALYKNPTEHGELGSVCLLGLARVARLSLAGMSPAKLFDMRKDPLMSAPLRIEYYVELINVFSFQRDFAKAKQLVSEIEATAPSLTPKQQHLLRSSQAFMLTDAKEFAAAEVAMKQARAAAQKLGPFFIGWIDQLEGNIHLGKKDFAKAKASYQKAVPVIGTKSTGFNALWVHYLGLKVGFYMGDQALINSSLKECANILRGTESEAKFTPLINAWAKLHNRADISGEIAALTKSLGPNTNMVEELNVAKAWQKTK